MGERTFGREAKRKVDLPNRDLFTEFCMVLQLLVANTLKLHPAVRQRRAVNRPFGLAVQSTTSASMSWIT
eukprot:4829529-Pyramimonas_sp.AAC.1